MKYLVLVFGLIFPVHTLAQTVNFEDDFSDRDISNWFGDIENFTFIDEAGNILLQQDAEGAGSSFLSIPSTDTEGYWEFFIRMDFAPSAGNRTEIYLMSDTRNLNEALNGYKLLAGENGSDDVFRLMRIDNGSEASEIITGTTDISSGGDFRVKVTRDASGNWTLEVAEGYAGILGNEGNGTDNTYSSSSYFGFKTTYTSTRSDLFAFDFKIDIPPITVSVVSIVDDQVVDVTFSREVDFNTVQTSDFILNPGSNSPESILQPTPETARLNFGNAISSGQNTLSISGDIEDALKETSLADTTISLVFFDTYQQGDIIINEFMKDPPEGTAEYVELLNTSNRYLNLRDWQLGDNNTITTITTEDAAILPGEFTVISADTATLYNFYGKANYLQASLPALNNSGDQIRVFNGNGALADSLEYTSEWGGVDVALERLDSNVASTLIDNWGDSPSENFGTPGSPNLLQADNTPPFIKELIIQDARTLLMAVSEGLDRTSAENETNYILSQNPDPGATVAPLPSINSVVQIAPDTVEIQLSEALQEYLGSWTLSVENLSDIFGNATSDAIEFNYFEIFTATIGQVAINEFMYDPVDEFSEFIELYNHSDSSFDLQDWTLNDNTGNQRTITDGSLVLPKGEYVILAADSTLINNFPDAEIITMASRFPALNNSTDAIVIRNQDGIEIDSLTFTSEWGGNEVSLERRSVEIPGIFRENWGDSPSENLATPGIENEISSDETPPNIASQAVISERRLMLVFNERVLANSAQNPSNYTIEAPSELEDSVPDLELITFLAPDTVILDYQAALPKAPEGSEYQLLVANQQDIFGNTASVLQASFFLIDIALANPGEVVINEFMYDPNDELTEFIELFNHTENNFDLQGWTFNDNTGNTNTITETPFEIITGSYVILTSDSSLYNLYPEREIIVMGNRFSALNNGSDDIVIRNQNGILIDSLSYRSNWGGNETSLERRSIEAPSFYKENWGDSPAEEAATPGLPNLIEPDNEPPKIINSFVVTPDSIRLIFSERVDSIQANDLGNYSISPNISISGIHAFTGDSLTLALASALTDGQNYTITIENQEDIFGNTLPSATVEFDFTEVSDVAPGNVVINEILYRRESADSEEFIELYNRSDKNFDLSNWTLSDAVSSSSIPNNIELRSGEFLVLTDMQDFANKLQNGIYLSGFPSLNDNEDAIVIKNKEGIVIDSLFYSNLWGGDDPGISVERKDPQAPSNDASNWTSSISESGHTAGDESSVFEPDQTSPEVIFAKLQSDRNIYVAFSEFVNIENTSVTVNNESSIISGYQKSDANIVTIGQSNYSAGEPLNIRFSNLADFSGNTSQELTIEASQPLIPGDVVINEILYKPLANSDDNLPDQTEYIELYNRADYAISLEGISLHDEPNEDNEVRSLLPVTSQFKWIQPEGYALLYAEDEAELFGQSKLGEYFEMESESNQFTIRIDRTSLSLANADDAIYLADSAGTTIDSVFYDENWQNPNLYDTDGVALERIDPAGPSDESSNWSSSTNVTGGTPLEQNSIFQEAGIVTENTGITFTPNPFSPDDDGFEDNLFINYKLDEADYLIRIRIFDRYGRKVRKLADAYPAGFEGSIIWDGLTDDSRKNRVGIYIVLFEAYDSANGRHMTIKETVVLAKKF